MGLLDMPLISEMDEIEKKASKGDEASLRMVLDTLPNITQAHVHMLERRGLTLREAFEKAGIAIVCMR